VRLGLAKRNDHAPSQEAPELGLLWGPAHLGDHQRGNQWNHAKFQTGLVFSPCSPLVSIGGHENGRVFLPRRIDLPVRAYCRLTQRFAIPELPSHVRRLSRRRARKIICQKPPRTSGRCSASASIFKTIGILSPISISAANQSKQS